MSSMQQSLLFGGGTSAAQVEITNQSIIDDGDAGGGTGLARYWLYSDGTAGYETNWGTPQSGLFSGEWRLSGASSDYEARATTVSGTGTGTTGSWLLLSTSRSWTKIKATTGYAEWVLTMEIRRVSDSTVLDTATITLGASGLTGGDPCVVLGSWVENNRLIDELTLDTLMTTFRPEEGFSIQKIQKLRPPTDAECVKITTELGAILRCSKHTPFNLKTAKYDKQDGHWKRAPDMLNEYVMVDRYGIISWEKVTKVENIGIHKVVPISFGGRSFAAGDTQNALIYSHNMAKAIP